MIYFNHIEIEGFGSIIKPLTYKLSRPGINVISAKNGIGKTTIFSALYWALYGKPLKKNSQVKTWEDLRGSDYKGVRVLVDFTKDKVNFQVIAHEDYKGKKSTILLLQDGKERQDLRDKKDVRNEIINILGYSADLFKNSIIFGQKMKRIIEEDGPIKKKIFDDIFDIHYLKVAKDKAEETLTSLKLERAKIEIQLEGNNKALSLIRGELANLKNTQLTQSSNIKALVTSTNNLKEGTQKSIDDLNAKVKLINKKKPEEKLMVLSNSLVKIQKRLAKIKEVDDNKFKLELKVEMTKGSYQDENTTQTRLKLDYTTSPKKCNSCGQQLTPNHIQNRKRQIMSAISESKSRQLLIKNSLIPLEEQLKQYGEFLELHKHAKDRITDINKRILLEQAKIKERDEYISNIDIYKQRIIELDGELVKIGKMNTPINLSEIRSKLKTEKGIRNSLLTEEAYYDKQLTITSWLIKDPLSNSGIKAFIFDSMLNLINEKLIRYSNMIGFTINFGIDLESANKDFYITIKKRNKLRFYEDLSGGQQQLCNVCIAFAIHDLICVEKSSNILILDEAFESLDQENIEIVSKLIYEKSQGKSVHVITHQTEFNPINSKIIRLVNKGGNTEMR